ncbi:hypothetical protein ACP275_11G122100 [Erythranthe tilingii]
MTELNDKLFFFSYQVIHKFTEDIRDFVTEEIEEELHRLVDVETRDIVEKRMAERIKMTIAVQKVIEDEDEDEEDEMEELEKWCAMLDELEKQGADGPVPEEVEKGGLVPEEVEMQEIEKVGPVPQEVEKGGLMPEEVEKGGSVKRVHHQRRSLEVELALELSREMELRGWIFGSVIQSSIVEALLVKGQNVNKAVEFLDRIESVI